MDYSITNTAGLGFMGTGPAGDTASPANGGGFLSKLGNTFNDALGMTFKYGLPAVLDYDYTESSDGRSFLSNTKDTDLTGYDPEFVSNVRQQRAGMIGGGNTGLYIAGGLALLGVIVVLKG